MKCRKSLYFLPMLILLFTGTVVLADNPSYSDQYPKTGTTDKTIVVKGKIDLDSLRAYSPKTTGLVKIRCTPANGGQAVETEINGGVAADQTEGEVSWGASGELTTNNNLTSGTTYNVIVMVELSVIAKGTNQRTTAFYETPPKPASAK